MKRREALTRILNSISEDNQMSKEVKQERLEKMIREELEENNSERQTPIQSLLPTGSTPGAPTSGDRSPNRFSPNTSGHVQF